MCRKVEKCQNVREECHDHNSIDCGCFSNPAESPKESGQTLAPGSASKICMWNYDTDMDYYSTGCGHDFTLNEGTPAENSMKYCMFCGFEIEE